MAYQYSMWQAGLRRKSTLVPGLLPKTLLDYVYFVSYLEITPVRVCA